MKSETKFSVTNYIGITVSCTKDRWDNHIVSGHKEMEESVEAVKDTIKKPDIVFKSSQFSDAEVYFKDSEYKKRKCITKVIVNYYSGKKDPSKTVGYVNTAFYVKKIGGGIGDVVYEAADNEV